MLDLAEVETLLRDAGVEAEITDAGEFPDEPGQVVLLYPAGGAGNTYERLFERPALGVRVRGDQLDPGSAKALATQVDKALMDPDRITLGARHVTSIDYLGGPPAFLARDEAERTILACTYIVELARE